MLEPRAHFPPWSQDRETFHVWKESSSSVPEMPELLPLDNASAPAMLHQGVATYRALTAPSPAAVAKSWQLTSSNAEHEQLQVFANLPIIWILKKIDERVFLDSY